MNTDKPNWWNEEHASTWGRAKEALGRDWEQTKHDLGIGGHELNQNLDTTMAQASGGQVIPPVDQANPPKTIGRWEDVEPAIGFGYAARGHYGDRYPKWSGELERALHDDWHDPRTAWNDVKKYVRHGYELRH
jgi:hypothetical protein